MRSAAGSELSSAARARGADAAAPASRLDAGCARAALGSTKMRSSSPGGSVNSSAPSSVDSGPIGKPVRGAPAAATSFVEDLPPSAAPDLGVVFFLGTAGARGGAAGVPGALEAGADTVGAVGAPVAAVGGAAFRGGAGASFRGGLNFSMSCRRANSTSVASRSSPSDGASGGAGRVGTANAGSRRRALPSRETIRGDPRRRRKGARILRQPRERIEHLAAAAAAHLAAGGAQHLGRQLEHRFAFGALRVQARPSPSVDATPIVALKDLHDIKTGGVRGLHRVGLAFQQSRQDEIGARACRPPVSTGASSIRGSARIFATTKSAGGRPAAARPDLELLGDPVAHGIVARGDQCLRIEIDGDDVRCAEFQRGYAQDPGAASIIDHRSGRPAAGRRAFAGTAPWSDGCPCRTPSPGSSRTITASGSSGGGATVGHTQSRRPKRIGFQSSSHTRSQSRLSTARTLAHSVMWRARRWATRPTLRGLVESSNSARTRVSLHSRISSGLGSSTGSSPRSRR